MIRKQTVAISMMQMAYERVGRSSPLGANAYPRPAAHQECFVKRTDKGEEALAWFDMRTEKFYPFPTVGKNTMARNKWAAREFQKEFDGLMANLTEQQTAEFVAKSRAEVEAAFTSVRTGG